MPLMQYSTPAFINDIPANLKKQWSDVIAFWFAQAVKHLKNDFSLPEKNIFFFDELLHPEAEKGTVVPIPWNAYPRKYKLVIANDEDRWYKTEQLYNSDLGDEMMVYYFYKIGSKYQR